MLLDRIRKPGFTLVEVLVAIAIVSLIAVFAIPIYDTNMQRANVSKIVNKLGTFKMELTDTYAATGSWPASINGVASGNTAANTFFDDAVNFRYNTLNNKAWVGYQLSSDYGSGWVFLVVIADDDEAFDIHCGSLNSTCTLGYCNSQELYPSPCSEENMHASYTLE